MFRLQWREIQSVEATRGMERKGTENDQEWGRSFPYRMLDI